MTKIQDHKQKVSIRIFLFFVIGMILSASIQVYADNGSSLQEDKISVEYLNNDSQFYINPLQKEVYTYRLKNGPTNLKKIGSVYKKIRQVVITNTCVHSGTGLQIILNRLSDNVDWVYMDNHHGKRMHPETGLYGSVITLYRQDNVESSGTEMERLSKIRLLITTEGNATEGVTGISNVKLQIMGSDSQEIYAFAEIKGTAVHVRFCFEEETFADGIYEIGIDGMGEMTLFVDGTSLVY